MSDHDIIVRPIRPDDDFDVIEELFFQTHYANSMDLLRNHNIQYRKENWKGILFPAIDSDRPIVLKGLLTKGFIAVRNGKIEAFATIGISPDSHNGYLEYGHTVIGKAYLGALVTQCEQSV